MNNKNFQPEENEILSGDDEKIRQMLGNLKRVDAPKDFDFRLKARIADAEPQNFQAPRLFPVLRYAAPLALAIVVLAVVVINGLYSFDNNSVASVPENPGKPKVENSISTNNFQPEENFIAQDNPPAANMEIIPASAVNSNKPEKKIFSRDSELAANIKKPGKDEPKKDDNDIRSRVESSENPKVLVPQEFGSNNLLSVREVLLTIGIEANLSDKKWKVKSVTPNSIAERSGVKTDDVIEAIDEKQLSTEPINTKGSFTGKRLIVVRGGERMEISLQNK